MDVFEDRLELKGIGAQDSVTITFSEDNDSDALSDADPFDIF